MFPSHAVCKIYVKPLPSVTFLYDYQEILQNKCCLISVQFQGNFTEQLLSVKLPSNSRAGLHMPFLLGQDQGSLGESVGKSLLVQLLPLVFQIRPSKSWAVASNAYKNILISATTKSWIFQRAWPLLVLSTGSWIQHG